MPRILIGVTGSIAAYKAAELIRLLRKNACEVQVVMTEHAQAFITPLTLQSLSAKPVLTNWCAAETQTGMDHIELARWPDKIICAPASANTIAKLAQGLADDLLTTLCLASSAPLFIAPAMNINMWQHPATLQNIKLLQERGVTLIGPALGEQACGDIGLGRMVSPEEIANILLPTHLPLKNLNVLITAGPTQEHLDPVRYLSNHSSGKMGFALAKAAQESGAKVTLVTGPTHLQPLTGISTLNVTSAQQMQEAVMQHISGTDIFIAAAAVADYRPKFSASQKIKKSQPVLQLELEKNPDILHTVGQLANKPFSVGFALETENLIPQAQQKLLTKNIDLMIANLATSHSGFNSNDNEVTVIDRKGNIETLIRANKTLIAQQIIDRIASLYFETTQFMEETV